MIDAENPRKTSKTTKIALGLIVLAVGLSWAVKRMEGPSYTPTAPAEDKDRSFVFAAVKTLQQSVKNPDSFTLTRAFFTTDGFACIDYRATNSFNAVVPGRAVISLDVASSEDADWWKYCTNKTGKTYSFPGMF